MAGPSIYHHFASKADLLVAAFTRATERQPLRCCEAGGMRTFNLAVKFFLELACFAALAYAGAVIGAGVWAIVLALLLPAVAIAVWARWNAPRSPRRLPTRRRVPMELAVFAVAAGLLAAAGAPAWAAGFAVLVVANAVLLTAFGQWEP